ncbi:hypothetical protein QYF36_013153 [Acer negundo]|nr:hypothetical protein QYF36_013153 [Acer negundo]
MSSEEIVLLCERMTLSENERLVRRLQDGLMNAGALRLSFRLGLIPDNRLGQTGRHREKKGSGGGSQVFGAAGVQPSSTMAESGVNFLRDHNGMDHVVGCGSTIPGNNGDNADIRDNGEI